MFPPFDEDEAFSECRGIISGIECGKITVRQVSAESAERAGQGLMLGVLVCTDKNGNKVVLSTVSGIGRELVFTPPDRRIFVPPVVSSARINACLEKNDAEIHCLTDKINELKSMRRLSCSSEEPVACGLSGSALRTGRSGARYSDQSELEKSLRARRAFLTKESLLNVYSQYSFCCADGKEIPLLEICAEKLPPTGTGDCCAPKLLDFAFRSNLVPVSMAEVFYGRTTKNKVSGQKYSPCDERCAIILPRMLGIKIIYRDEDIIVVDKQSGILSVPGRGPEKQDCIVNRVRRLFPYCIEQPAVHRLDMETSGLMVLAFTEEAHRRLNRQFESKEIKKEYVALLDGVLKIPDGQTELFFRVDVDNRPHQIWDEIYGKKAVTQWHKIADEQYAAPDGTNRLVSRVLFIPHTGRTHQLRLAAADSHGFGIPIIGDTLYGTCRKGERLMLHAQYLCFTHPVSGRKMEFFCRSEF